MRKQMELNVVTEQNLALTARLLLIINRKQIELDSMNLDSDYLPNYYRYNLQLTGDLHMLQQAKKVIAKQIGVFEVKFNTVELVRNTEMAMA